jgi:hypothetical protein
LFCSYSQVLNCLVVLIFSLLPDKLQHRRSNPSHFHPCGWLPACLLLVSRMEPRSIFQVLHDIASAPDLDALRQISSPLVQRGFRAPDEQDLFSLSVEACVAEQKFTSITFLKPLCQAVARMLELLGCARPSDPLLLVSTTWSVLVAAAVHNTCQQRAAALQSSVGA